MLVNLQPTADGRIELTWPTIPRWETRFSFSQKVHSGGCIKSKTPWRGHRATKSDSSPWLKAQSRQARKEADFGVSRRFRKDATTCYMRADVHYVILSTNDSGVFPIWSIQCYWSILVPWHHTPLAAMTYPRLKTFAPAHLQTFAAYQGKDSLIFVELLSRFSKFPCSGLSSQLIAVSSAQSHIWKWLQRTKRDDGKRSRLLCFHASMYFLLTKNNKKKVAWKGPKAELKPEASSLA